MKFMEAGENQDCISTKEVAMYEIEIPRSCLHGPPTHIQKYALPSSLVDPKPIKLTAHFKCHMQLGKVGFALSWIDLE